jgi:hypothetical protein
MNPDESYSLVLLACLLVVITQKQVSSLVLEILLKLTRPASTVCLLGFLVFLYHKQLHYTFLVFGLLVVFLLKDMWTLWPKSDARRLYLELGRDQDRFDHSSSIDLQMADGTIKHASPNLYHHDWKPKLLIFPPSASTLQEMNG